MRKEIKKRGPSNSNESNPVNPTICAHCKHFKKSFFPSLSKCMIMEKIDFVTGNPVWSDPWNKNKGCCNDFDKIVEFFAVSKGVGF